MPDEGARDEILGRIAAAVAGVASSEPDRAFDGLERSYRTGDAATSDERLDRFEERLVDYGVDVLRCRAAVLPDALAAELGRRRVAELVVPGDLPPHWLAASEVATLADDVAARRLDSAGGVLTGCALAVAETGTIVLDGGPGQGRRAATLVPDLHLCVVTSSQVVATVPEAVARLAGAVRQGRPLTWISGPSATSDIELVRVAGVHGPRTLVVILVRDG